MQMISVHELKKRLSDGDIDEILIDVRSPAEFKSRHISGAKNVPMETAHDSIERLKTIQSVYVQCESGSRSFVVCRELEQAGVNAINIDGGLHAWERAGFDLIRTGKQVIPIMRQMMIVAGLMILVGVGLGIWVHPWWYALSAFVGAGLLFGGVTGICAMTRVLSFMPWNR